MLRVDVALVAVQVVALVVELGDEDILIRKPQALVVRQFGRFSRPHVGEDQSPALDARIRAMLHLVREPAPLRLARLVEAIAVDVEQPPVVDAAEATVLDAAVAEVCPPVRAPEAKKSEAAELVSEERKVLAHDPQRQRRAVFGQFLRQRHRLPVPPEQVPGGRSRPCPGQQLVIFLRQHVTPPSGSPRGRVYPMSSLPTALALIHLNIGVV